MTKTAIAVGAEAIRKTAAIMAAAETGRATMAGLAPGTQWGGDRLLLSVEDGNVQFVIGSTLYSQNQAEFLRAEFPTGSASAGRASWLRGLTPYEMPFCMALAGELPPAWPGMAVCAFLDRFGHYYGSHRPKIELAGREARHIVEGLLALQHWPELLGAVLDSMGEAARWSFPKGLAAGDLGAFVGKLLIGTPDDRITLAGIPGAMQAIYSQDTPSPDAYRQIPQYRRTLDKLERHAESAAPLLEELRAVLR